MVRRASRVIYLFRAPDTTEERNPDYTAVVSRLMRNLVVPAFVTLDGGDAVPWRPDSALTHGNANPTILYTRDPDPARKNLAADAKEAPDAQANVGVAPTMRRGARSPLGVLPPQSPRHQQSRGR